MWSCPSCGAPQAETARCWVCHQSSTTCSTCRHFRRSLAADVGWCSLDPKRLPLTGLEMRGCWEQRRSTGPAVEAADQPPAPRLRRTTPYRPTQDLATPARTFVPVELLGPIRAREPAPPEPSTEAPLEPPPIPIVTTELEESWTDRTNLFGDFEG